MARSPLALTRAPVPGPTDADSEAHEHDRVPGGGRRPRLAAATAVARRRGRLAVAAGGGLARSPAVELIARRGPDRRRPRGPTWPAAPGPRAVAETVGVPSCWGDSGERTAPAYRRRCYRSSRPAALAPPRARRRPARGRRARRRPAARAGRARAPARPRRSSRPRSRGSSAGVPVEQLLMLTFSRRAAAELRDRVTARLGRTIREPIARTFHSYAFGVLRHGGAAPRAARAAAARRRRAGRRHPRAARRAATPTRWPAALRPALRTAGFAAELRDLLHARRRARPRRPGAGRARARARPRRLGRGRASSSPSTTASPLLRRSRRLRPGRADPRRAQRAARRPGAAGRRARAAPAHLRRRVPGHRPRAGRAAAAAGRRRRRAGPGRRPRPVDLRLPRRRRVGDPRRRRALRRAARPCPVVALADVPAVRRRRCSPPPAGSPRGCPGRAEQRALRRPPDVPPGALEVARVPLGQRGGRLPRRRPARAPPRRPAVVADGGARPLDHAHARHAAPGDDHRRRAGRGARRRPPAGRAAGGRDAARACSRCVARADAALDRGRRRGAAASARSAAATGARCAGCAALLRAQFPDEASRCSCRAAARRRRRASCCPSTSRRPVAAGGPRARRRARGVAAGGSTEDVLWAIWQPPGWPRRWEPASRGRRRRPARRPTATSTPSSQLFDAAARFTDRLPGAERRRSSPSTSRAQQIPGDTFAGRAGRRRTRCRILTAHASKGLEWDLVCVADVQEGSWPDLRRRGSLLGTEALVDAVARPRRRAGRRRSRRSWPRSGGCSTSRPPAPAAGSSSPPSRGDEEQPSRFLDELDPCDGDRELAAADPRRPPARPGRRAARRRVRRRRDADAERRGRRGRARPAGRRRRAGRRPGRLVGAGAAQHRRRRWPTPTGRCGSARRGSSRSCAASCARCCRISACSDDRGRRRRRSARRARARRRRRRTTSRSPSSSAQLDEVGLASTSARRWFADNERARATTMLERLVAWLRDSRAELDLVGVERDFEVDVGDARAQRPGRPARARRRGPARRRRPQDRQEQAQGRRHADAPAARRLPARDRARRVRRRRRRGRRRACSCSSARPASRSSSGSRRWRSPTTRTGRGAPSTRSPRGMRGHEFTAIAERALPASATCAHAARCRSRAGRCRRDALPSRVDRPGRARRGCSAARSRPHEQAAVIESGRSSRRPSSPAPARARPRRWPRASSGWSPTGSSRPTRCSA